MRFDTILTPEVASRYRAAGLWADRTLADCLRETVRRTPGKVALVAPGGRRMTYAQLAEEAERVAGGLAGLGIGPGDVISIQLPNCAEFVCLHLAATLLGAVTNPLLPNYRANELCYILNFARSAVVVVPSRHRGFDFPAMYAGMRPALVELEHIVVVGDPVPDGMRAYDELARHKRLHVPAAPASVAAGDEISALIFTSGTESKPKGVMHSHNTMMYATLTMAKLLGLSEDDVVWMPSPVGHGTGFLWGVRQALTIGAKLVLQDVWAPEDALGLIEAEGCTYTLSATPFAAMLVEAAAAGYDTGSLRYFACAGAPIPQPLGRAARERLGCLLIGMWGMSECFVGSASAPADPEDKLWGSDGKAMPGTELAIFDETRSRRLGPGEEGELATRGPHVALGYFADPVRTRETFSPEGWLFSNDLATMDRDGYVRIVGRKKDIINRGGLKVSAREVEELLLEHPSIRQVAMVGVPDARLGEKSCAFVVPRERRPVLSELMEYLEAHGVAKYKFPEYLVLVDALPMTASGKVQKFALRDGFGGGAYRPEARSD